MFEAIVWDDRDTGATEPSSTLGEYFTEQEAQDAINSYLTTQHGPHIYKFAIVPSTREWKES